MELLNRSEIKNQKSKKVIEVEGRIQKLFKHENELIQKVGIAQENHDCTIKRLGKEMAKFTTETKIKKAKLVQEVVRLEEEKAFLMQPIDKIREQAEEYKNIQLDKIEQLEKDKKTLQSSSETLQQQLEDNIDYKHSLDEREENIARGELSIKKAKDELKTSTECLKDQWVKYYNSVEGLNKEYVNVESKKNKLETFEKVLKIKEEELKKYSGRIAEEKRQLESNYQALIQAKRHLNKK